MIPSTFSWFLQPFNCRNPSGFPGQWVAQGQQNMCLKLTIFTALGSSAAPWGCDVYIWNSIIKGAGKRWCNKSDHPCIAMYYGFAYRTTDYSCFLDKHRSIYQFWLTLLSFILKLTTVERSKQLQTSHQTFSSAELLEAVERYQANNNLTIHMTRPFHPYLGYPQILAVSVAHVGT